MSSSKKDKAAKMTTADVCADIKSFNRLISPSELSKHNTDDSVWVAIHGRVFDFTDFYMDHPGGFDVIEESAGKDGTKKFEDGDHRPSDLKELRKYCIGEFDAKKQSLAEKKKQEAMEQLE